MFYLFVGGGFGNLPYKERVARLIIFIRELSPPHKAEFPIICRDVALYIIKSIHLPTF